MPIAPQFLTKQITELASQIKLAPVRVQVEQMKNIESLLVELNDELMYPLDYIIFRILGIRSNELKPPMLSGRTVVRDLVTSLAVISRKMHLPSGETLSLKDIEKKLGVSARTVNRLRHEGLPLYWVIEPNGRRRLGCHPQSLATFQKRKKQRLVQARHFNRLSFKERNMLIQHAMEKFEDGKTINEVALELKGSSGRGLETIRALLKKNVEIAQMFSLKPALTRQDARDIEAGIKEGKSWSDLAAKFNRSKNALRGAVARLRGLRLRGYNIPYVDLPVFTRSDAREVILNASVVQNCLPPILEIDVLDIDSKATLLNTEDETAIISAMHLLKRCATQNIKALKYTPNESLLDEIETDLRWSFLLQQSLILAALPIALSVATQHAGRPLKELPARQKHFFCNVTISIACEVCGCLDLSSNQSVSKTTALMVDRQLTLGHADHIPKRAAARTVPTKIKFPFYDSIAWSKLMPKSNLLLKEELSPQQKQIVCLKFGWGGFPRTNLEIANFLKVSRNLVSRTLRTY